MNITNVYHLYLNDYTEEDSPLQGRFYLGNEPECSDDIAINLQERPLNQQYRFAWDEKLQPRPGVDKVLCIYGSPFAKMMFSAISKCFVECWNEEYFTCGGSDQEAPIKVIDTPFSDRLNVFAGLCKKFGFNKSDSHDVLIGWGEKGEDAARLADELNKKSDYAGFFPVHYIGVPIHQLHDDGTLNVAIVDSEIDLRWFALHTSNNLAFYFNEKEEFDDALNPFKKAADTGATEHFLWQFNDILSLQRVLAAYVESYLIAPSFARLCREFGEQMFHRLDSRERLDWLLLTRVFPFTVAEIKGESVVELPCNINVHYINMPQGERSPLRIAGEDLDRKTIDEDLVRYSFVPDRVGPFEAYFKSEPPPNLPPFWQNEKCFVLFSENDCRVVHADGCKFEVVNHRLTTVAEISIDDAFTADNVHYRMPVNDLQMVWVRAKNKFDQTLVPLDANDWKWIITGGDGIEVAEMEERGAKALRIVPKSFGRWQLSVYWDDTPPVTVDTCTTAVAPVDGIRPNRKPRYELELNVLARGDKLVYKIEPVAKKGHVPFKVKYDGDGNATFDCFPADEFTLQAWLEGPSTPLWDARVKVADLKIEPWDDKEKKHKMAYRSIGTKVFEISPMDAAVRLSYRVTCHVKKNYSDIVKKMMIGGSAIAALHAWLVYGLNWWTMLVYAFPLITFGVYKYNKWPLYKWLITVLFAVDVFCLLHAIWEEVC